MPSRSIKPPRCQHKPSASCALCRREKNDLQQVGAWAREPSTTTTGAQSESIDYASFVQDTALRTTTSKAPIAPPVSHSKRSTSNNPSNQSQQHHRTKFHHSTLPILLPNPKTPTSSVAATRSNSPIAHRPVPTSASVSTSTSRIVPVYQNGNNSAFSRQAAVLPGSSKLNVTAAAAATAPTARRPGSHFVLAQGGVGVSDGESEEQSESEEEEESESESQEDSDESDDDGEDDDDDDE